MAKKQIRCGLSRAFFMTTRSGPQAVRPSFATRPVPVSQLVPYFDGWILMSCIRCCRDMAESGSRACDRHGRLTCMASALVCGAERPAPFGTLPCSPAFSCIHAESGKLNSIRKQPVKGAQEGAVGPACFSPSTLANLLREYCVDRRLSVIHAAMPHSVRL